MGSCCVPRTIPRDRPRPRHVLKGHSSIAQTARGHRPPGLCVQIHTLQRMNLPSPSLAAAPLTARDAVDPRHVHEQPDKPVPGPSHVRNGQSLSAQGSPHSGYPGDPSPPAPQPQRGWLPPATIRHHPLFRRSRTARPARRPPAPGTTDPGRGLRGSPGVERSEHPRERRPYNACTPKAVPDSVDQPIQRGRPSPTVLCIGVRETPKQSPVRRVASRRAG